MKILRRVILFELIIAVFLTVVIFSILIRFVYLSGLKKSVAESLAMNEQLAARVDTYFKDLEKFSASIENDYELKSLLNRDMKSHSAKNEAYIKNYLSNLGRYNSMDPYQVFGLIFILDGGNAYTTIGLNHFLIDDITSQILPLYYRNGSIPLFSRPLVYKNVVVRQDIFNDAPSYVYCYVSPYQNGNVKGDMIIISRYDNISAIFSNYVKDKTDFVLLDRFNETVYPGKKSLSLDYTDICRAIDSGSMYMQSNAQTGDSFFTIRYSRYGDWKLVVEGHKADILRQNREMLITYFSLLLIFMMAFFGILIPLLNGIFTPLNHLSEQMRKVSEGNLDVTIEVRTNDEIGELGSVFNYMLAELKSNIAILMEKNKKESELKYNFMLSRIDPHFIYNTMNTLTYLAKKGRSEDVVQVNDAIIEILKDRLRIDVYDSFDTVAHEINTTKQYIVIQQYRYEDVFKVAWNVRPDVLDYEIPKSIIQPLVENALNHGILENKDDEGELLGGLISISVLRTQRKLCIEVKDNGRGMSDKEYYDVLHSVHADRGKRIGLKNIRERLQYIYGSDYDFAIITREGVGTRVFLTVPMKETEVKTDHHSVLL
ncbi:MAG: histidine kinase [Treponema sp.]|nr:histidine kinase [Treponema sp.]